jgi:hypothetical protein
MFSTQYGPSSEETTAPPLPPAPAAPEPPFEVENLGRRAQPDVPAHGRQTNCLFNLFARGHAFFVLSGEERKRAKTDQERDRSAIDATTVPLKVFRSHPLMKARRSWLIVSE